MSDTRDFMAQTDAIGTIGAAFYFAPSTVTTGKEHGLDGFRFYFLGRGGVLGDVEPEVVASAFGYFNPGLVAKMWNSAKEKMAPRDAARLYIGCGHEFAREKLAGVDGLGALADALGQVNDAVDPAGLSLYSGVDAEPVPDDDAARAFHLCMVLREARGSAHLLAVRATGLSPRAAHQIKRPDDVATFGWEPLELGDDHRERWQRAEDLTDDLLEPAFEVLDESQRRTVLDGLAAVSAALA